LSAFDSQVSTSDEPGKESPKPHGRWLRPLILIAAAAVVILLTRWLGLGEKLIGLRGWIESLGAWGPVVYVLIYVAGVVAALPGSALTIAGGALFGSLLGTVLVSIASTTGAGLAFLIARYLARDTVTGWLNKNEKFRKLDEMTARHGQVMVALTRLVPVFPFNLLNYGYGLTRVPFRTYLFWSWLCMLPGTVVYVAGTDAVYTSISRGEVPWPLVIAVVAIAVILTLIIRHARKQLGEKETETVIHTGNGS
jgi:uncharacterized membrane protein YdjX (TVP38/TMEM64 family)